jgi:tetratricopeptide (TPR) repeat protein
MRTHPVQTLTAEVLQGLEVEEAGVIYHLLRCPACRREAELRLCPDPVDTVTRALRQEIDFRRLWPRLERLQAELLQQYQEEVAEGEPVLRELLQLGQRERLARVKVDEAARSVAHLLLREAARRGTSERRDLAEVAAAAVEQGLTGLCARIPGDIGLAAWSEIGETCRQENRLAEAEAALRRAASYLEEAADPAERARYLRRLARLRRDQDHFEEALALLDRAAHVFKTVGFEEERTGVLLERAWLHLERRHPQEARKDLGQVAAAGQYLAPASASALVRCNAWALVAEDHLEEAIAALDQGERLFGWSEGSKEHADCLALKARLEERRRGEAPGAPAEAR